MPFSSVNKVWWLYISLFPYLHRSFYCIAKLLLVREVMWRTNTQLIWWYPGLLSV